MAELTGLMATLDLETIELDIFRGRSPPTAWPRIFGGLVISQALIAACRTVVGREPHSLHGYFMLPGDPATPILYEVDRIRDGHSFTTRRCVGIQHGRAIFSLSASFHCPERGLEHSDPLPDVPPPEALEPVETIIKRFGDAASASWATRFERDRLFDIRPIDPQRYRVLSSGGNPRPAKQALWILYLGELPEDQSVHRAVLGYISDMTLLDTALVSHGLTIFDPSLQVASLDHALWFHRTCRADQWLLYAQDSPSSFGARAFTRGMLFGRDGQLVASACQEGLIRFRSRARGPKV